MILHAVLSVATGLVLIALAYRFGRNTERAARRASKGLRPVAAGQGIMAQVAAVILPCPTCGASVRRHPAVVDLRCAKCAIEATERDDEAYVEAMRAQGWGSKPKDAS